jgi:hypothetical protein
MIYYFEIEINKTIEEKNCNKMQKFSLNTNRRESVCGYFKTKKNNVSYYGSTASIFIILLINFLKCGE